MGETGNDTNTTNDQRTDELLAYLGHRDPQERERAALLLGKPGNKQAVMPLIDALHDSAEIVRSRAAQSLGTIGDRCAVEPLIDCLDDADVYVRIEAAIALGEIGDEQATDALVPIIEDKRGDSRLRASAVKALGLTAGQAEHYLDVLLEAAEDEDEDVQQAAIEALYHVDDVQLTDRYIKLLQERFDVSNNNMMDIISKLGETKDPRAVEPLTHVLTMDNLVYRELAAEALGRIGDRRALPALEMALRETSPASDPAFYPQLVTTVKKSIESIRTGKTRE